MASTSGRARCVTCGKERSAVRCECGSQMPIHPHDLIRQLDQISLDRDRLYDAVNKQMNNSQSQKLIKQIDQWEREAITLIQYTANKCRRTLLEQENELLPQMERRLAGLTEKLQRNRRFNDANEADLASFTQQIEQLNEQVLKLSNVSIQYQWTPLLYDLTIAASAERFICSTRITDKTKWKQNGVTVAGGNRRGSQLYQLHTPFGIYVDDDQSIYIADGGNHRVVQWNRGATRGQVVAGGNGQGHRIDQLDEPRDVIVDRNSDAILVCDQGNRRIVGWPRRSGAQGQVVISGSDGCRLTLDNNGDLYVSDHKKHEVRRWRLGDRMGEVVAGGNGPGHQLNQLNGPTFISVDDQQSVYVSDWNNCRVMKWLRGAREGIIVAGGDGQGSSRSQLSHPQGVIVDHLGNVYVADSYNHRIVRWLKEAKKGSVIAGDHGLGQQSNQLNYPSGLSFDREGNLYVADWDNDRIQKFDIDES